MLYWELNTVGGYLSPACGGGKITSTQFFLIDKGILQWCAKGIVIIRKVLFDNISNIPIWLCIVPPAEGGGNNTKEQPFLSSAIHIKIGSQQYKLEVCCHIRKLSPRNITAFAILPFAGSFVGKSTANSGSVLKTQAHIGRPVFPEKTSTSSVTSNTSSPI